MTVSRIVTKWLISAFSFLFGGFGYGPDSTHSDDHYGTIFDSNYESQGVKYFHKNILDDLSHTFFL